jgi:hypothetical protein
MENCALANIPEDARKVLAIFERFGRDGRSITTRSLAIHAKIVDPKRLLKALEDLGARGLIAQGGDDYFTGTPIAFRLVTTHRTNLLESRSSRERASHTSSIAELTTPAT